MRPLRIYIKNFMGNRESDIDCTKFKSTLIVGKSKHDDNISNGVGKTTLLKAIEYVLFNEAYKLNLDKVVKSGQNKCIVELDFKIDGEIYRVYRHRTLKGSADLRLYKKIADNWESISGQTPTETEKTLNKILKITHKAFENSVLFRQDQITGLSTVDPKCRRELLKDPMNLSRWTKLEDITKKRITPLRKFVGQLETSIKMLGNPEQDIINATSELQECEGLIAKSYKEINESEIKLQIANDKLDRLKALFNESDANVEKKAIEQQNKCEHLSKKIIGLETARTKAESDVKKYETALEKIKSEGQRQRDKLQELREESSKYTSSPIELRDQLNIVEEDEKNGDNLVSRTELELEQLGENIPKENKCPTCKQNITEEYRNEFETSSQNKIKEKKKYLEELNVALTKCNKKKLRLRAEFDELAELNLKISVLTKQIESFNINTNSAEQNVINSKLLLAERNAELKALSDELIEEKEKLTELVAAVGTSKVSELQEQIEISENNIEKIKIDIKKVYNSISILQTSKGVLEERIRSRTEDKIKLEQLLKDLVLQQKEIKIHQKVVDAFSNKGIPTFIIHTILNELQFETNKALKELRPDLEIQLDADLNITYKRNGEPREYDQLSHGQHVYVALSFKRGLSRVIQKKLGVDLKLLEFDEVDAPLDKAGVKAFAHAVKRWQDDFTIFVITHNDSLKDKFSHAILVEEDDNGSEARVVSSW